MMNCGNNENKKEKLSLFTRIKKHIDNGRDEYIKNTSYKRFLYNIEDTLNGIFMLLFILGLMICFYITFNFYHIKNLEEYNNFLVSASAYGPLSGGVDPGFVPSSGGSSSDTITDLTGTTWEFNNSLNTNMINAYINFTSDNEFYVRLYRFYDDSSMFIDDNLYYYSFNGESDINSYNFGEWLNQAYKTITIIGGTDATNSTLISWLQSNATQIQTGPTQLTTPTLQSALDVQNGVILSWTADTSISSPYRFEIFRNGVSQSVISSSSSSISTYRVEDGVYKVRQLGDDNSYTDSEFSNEITITGLTHFTYNLGDNVSARTRFSLSSDDITLSDFYYLYNNYNFVISFEIDNNNADTGYVFNADTDFLTNSNITYTTNLVNNEFMQVVCSGLTGNFSCSVSSHSATKIAGKTYIYDNQLSSDNLSIGDYLIQNRPFVSNEKSFDNLYVNQYNYLVYDNVSTESDDLIYFLSNLTGQYISNSTFNYYLVTFDTLSAENSYFIQNYLSEDDIFFDYYRLATQSDLDNISALNEQLVAINENYTFLSLFGSIIDAHFNTIKSLINFNLFGINLWSIFTLILTLALVYMVYKFLHGGRKE